MNASLALVPLAQGHGSGHGGGGTVMTVVVVVGLAVVWIALGVVCWIFWRAKKREDLEKASREVEWPSARSS